LYLSNCGIKSPAIINSFPEAFPKNRTIKEIDLSKNKICDVGAEAICIGLSRNLGLKKLNLCANFIKEKGGRAFANCLKMNTGLEELNLKENNINDNAGQLLDNICRKNRNIMDINLDLNSLALNFVFNIKHNLKKNKKDKKKKIVPELKGKIRHLSQNSELLDKVKTKLKSKQSEFSELNKRVERNADRLSVISKEEAEKNKVVHDEFLKEKQRNLEVSKEFEELLYEITVGFIQKFKTHEEKKISLLSDQIGLVVSETKNGERLSKL